MIAARIYSRDGRVDVTEDSDACLRGTHTACKNDTDHGW